MPRCRLLPYGLVVSLGCAVASGAAAQAYRSKSIADVAAVSRKC